MTLMRDYSESLLDMLSVLIIQRFQGAFAFVLAERKSKR